MSNTKFEAGEGLKDLNDSDKEGLMEALQSDALKIVQRALNRTNKVLAKFGYLATIEIRFHKLEK